MEEKEEPTKASVDPAAGSVNPLDKLTESELKGPFPGLARSAPWAKLSVEEKLERCREQIKLQSNEFDHLRGMIYRMRADFSNHQHAGDQIVVPLKPLNEPDRGISFQEMPPMDQSQVYF